jgi:predicted secreted protein
MIGAKVEEFVHKPKNFKKVPDIYSGEEIMQFSDRHPIFKTLMKLEFEDILRNFLKRKSNS